jgi:uncharacterized protein YlzI (FlbEa/FlbD family)
MALFVTFEKAGSGSDMMWVNAELITYVQAGEDCTIIHFEKDHCLVVKEPIDRVMLQVTTGPIST